MANPYVVRDPAAVAFRSLWPDDPDVGNVLHKPVGVTLTPEASTRRAEIMADLNTYSAENMALFINGERSLEPYGAC